MIYILDQLYVMKSKVQQLEKGEREMKLALQHLEKGKKEMKTALTSCERRIQVIETSKFIYIQNIIETSNRIVYASVIKISVFDPCGPQTLWIVWYIYFVIQRCIYQIIIIDINVLLIPIYLNKEIFSKIIMIILNLTYFRQRN